MLFSQESYFRSDDITAGPSGLEVISLLKADSRLEIGFVK
jgi:hypothetical protein